MSTANEPAYPQPMTLCKDGSGFEWPDNGWGIGGLTKREVIAKDLMAALLAAGKPPKINGMEYTLECAACILTDALLAELERTEKP